LGWVVVNILILYFYRNRRYLIFIIPTFFVLLQFLFFYLRTGDFFLYFHAQQAYWGYSYFPISYPFNVMVTHWGNPIENLYLAIMYISQLWVIIVILSYLLTYFKNKDIDRLNLIIGLYFLLIQLMTGPRPRDLSRFSVLILPFCAVLLLIRFLNSISIKKLWVLIAFLCVINIFLIWYLIIADFLNVSDLGVIYEKASSYLLRKIS
ncbi:hypothetical protein, partial [Candidatus Borrarchaeum sp.]|uniref:hypothetical protein n=1 Tax=Candidatus Borrarchaeum sp. TaxID=2846742 RepID=UPI00257AB57A